MPRYIDADKLCELARNHIDGKVDANDIMRLPIADVQEVRHGKWTTKRTMRHDGEIYCSLCEYEPDAKYKHCPHCGAKMDGDEK